MNRREALAIVLLLAAILALGLMWPAPHAAGDSPAAATAVPQSEFVPLSVVLPSPVGSATVAPRSAGPGAPGYNPALRSSNPSPATHSWRCATMGSHHRRVR